MTAAMPWSIEDGVLAQERAGTPFPLAPEDSAAALAILEFPAALAVVAGYAAGPLGAARIQARRPTADESWIRAELAELGEVIALFRRGDRLLAAETPDVAAALARLRLDGSVLEPLELAAIGVGLRVAREIVSDLKRIAPSAPLTARRMVPLPDRNLEQRIAVTVDGSGDVLDTASPRLQSLRREVHAARERIVRKLDAILRSVESSAVPAGASVTMREGRYVIPVRRDSRQRPDGIVHDESGSQGTLFIEPTASIELGNALRAAVVDEQREVLRVLRELTDLLRPHRLDLVAGSSLCIGVDDLVARARYAVASGGEVPQLASAGGTLHLRHARHPLLLARVKAVVPFDLELGSAERTLLISGPNTGGKTVLLKTIGLAVALVASGIVPPIGAGSVVPCVGRLYADIGDHQSINADLSTFSAHVGTLRQVLDAADDATLVLLDEVGSGTDPAEGAALAAAALMTLTTRRARTVATTHLGALKSLASEVPGVVNGSLEFDAASLAPTFRFQKGVPGRSYGLAIARRLGVRPDVLALAEQNLPEAHRTLDALLEKVERRAQVLERQQTVVDTRLAESEAETARLQAQSEAQEVRERELRRVEKDADRRGREAAREYLLAARATVEGALAAAKGVVDEASAREARRLVEAGVQAHAAALDELEATPGETPDTAASPRVGRRVRTAAGATGTVLEVRGDGKLVVAAGALRLIVSSTAVEVLGPAPATKRPRRDAGASMPGPDAPVEVDLRGLRADEAEATTIAALDAAVLAEHAQLRIIHGMGTGVVRDVVRRIVGGDRRVARYDFAPRNLGGTGVTIVEFRG